MTPAGQRWTRSKPTEPGWYWYRGNSATPETAVRVEKGFKPYTATFFLTNSSVRHPVDDLNGEWQGPLTPNEATE